MEERGSGLNGEGAVIITQQAGKRLLHIRYLQSDLTVETEHPLQGEGAVVIAQQTLKRLLHIKYLLSVQKPG